MSAPRRREPRDWLLYLLGLGLRARTRLRGQRFACESLSGRARYDLSINADMTVSCTCNDQDGAGRLGDLDVQGFEEILAGPQARRFREQLAGGRLAIPRCAVCSQLRSVPPAEARARIDRISTPTALMVENTSKCNLACTSCRRDLVRDARRRPALKGDEIARVADIVRRNRIDLVHYFKLGEPFASASIRSELEILRAANPELAITLSTNGILLDSDDKREAALLLDDLVFSIDGVDTPTLRRYQVGGDFDAAYESLRRMVAFRNARGVARPAIGWRYVVFRWNDRPRAIERALALAREAGADRLELVYARTPLGGISWRRFLSPTHRRLGRAEGRWLRHVDLTSHHP
ncbi:MAG: radical SAM protein [Myxococcota bacterium]|nr:radical SAM protein [Myxococcota bacterium]